METITIKRDGLAALTDGLTRRGLPEMRVQVNTPSLISECDNFLRFVADYLATGVRIKPGETLNYGYWLVKFQPVDHDLLEVWEYNPEATGFVLGGSLALHYWQEQHRIC